MAELAGHSPQSDEVVAIVDSFKVEEEVLLRAIDLLREKGDPVDQRWLAIAQTTLQQGFMALNRAILRPQRIALPQDDAA